MKQINKEMIETTIENLIRLQFMLAFFLIAVVEVGAIVLAARFFAAHMGWIE